MIAGQIEPVPNGHRGVPLARALHQLGCDRIMNPRIRSLVIESARHAPLPTEPARKQGGVHPLALLARLDIDARARQLRRVGVKRTATTLSSKSGGTQSAAIG